MSPWGARCPRIARGLARITSGGQSEVYFDPGDKYIWSLAVMADGSLAVGTGDNGKLYRVIGVRSTA